MIDFITAAIDIGTTTISAAVVDSASGKQLKTINIPNDTAIESAFPFERIQDPKRIYALAKQLLDELIEAYPTIAAIGITGQMHGIVYIDDKGNATSPLYTWQDMRGNEVTEEIKNLTGYNIASGYGFATHYYNLKHSLVPKDSLSLCSIMDYLAIKLTNAKHPFIHPSVAASFGLFDIKNNCFDTLALSKLGITETTLPCVIENSNEIGRYKNIPVYAAIGDNQASVYACIGTDDTALVLNYGTGSQISIITQSTKANLPLEIRPYLFGANIVCGSGLCGGYSYAILEKFFGVITGKDNNYPLINALSEKAYNEGKKPLRVSTLFRGTREDPNLRGCITDIDDINFTPGRLALGFLQGMADELYDMYLLTGEKQKNRICASGNAVQKNPVFQKLLSDKYGMPLTLSSYKEEAATGAALYAGKCLMM